VDERLVKSGHMPIEFGGGHTAERFVPILDAPDDVNHRIPKYMKISRTRIDITIPFDIAPGRILKYIEPEITITEIRI